MDRLRYLGCMNFKTQGHQSIFTGRFSTKKAEYIAKNAMWNPAQCIKEYYRGQSANNNIAPSQYYVTTVAKG